MLLRTKLRMGSILLALAPSILASLLIGWIAIDKAETALKDQVQSRLTSLREDRARQITGYFESMREQALVNARNRMTIDAMQSFARAFADLARQAGADREQDARELKQYYTRDFAGEYSRRNEGSKADVNALFDRLDGPAVAMQKRYISSNSNPLGSKDNLIDRDDGSEYARLHALYHPAFRELQQRFGYYDIFLIEPHNGQVVYTVFKELDYATSLLKGPFAESGLADAFRGAMKLSEPGSIFITDFSPYLPSYQDPASFIATPIFENGQRVGVIAFQLPIDRINRVMTGDEQWQQSGLGESGETYLIGQDFSMRSQSRFLIEDPEGFIAAVAKTDMDDTTLRMIEAKQTVIGLQQVNTPGAQDAIGGETGFAEFPDYRGVPVLSAYKPIQIEGLRWAILAEIDQDEAYATVNDLHHHILLIVAGVSLVLLALGAALGWSFGASISRPLLNIVHSMQDISSGTGDLTVRLDESAKDELGQLSAAFNRFVEKLDMIMAKVGISTHKLAEASEELSVITGETREGVERQQQEILHVASAMERMSDAVRNVSDSTSATAELAHQAGREVETGKDVLHNNSRAIHELSRRMTESEKVVDALQEDSTRVGGVLDVIRGIAEQTNLLALNAAIEAARAGDQGRGFAVVASEVRVLAQRTQESTEEIRGIIESLQSRSTQTNRMLHENNDDLQQTVALAEQTQHAFQAIEEAVAELLGMSTQIADATEEQAAVAQEISHNVDNIQQVAEETADGAERTALSGQGLAVLGDELEVLVGQFKVSDTH